PVALVSPRDLPPNDGFDALPLSAFPLGPGAHISVEVHRRAERGAIDLGLQILLDVLDAHVIDRPSRHGDERYGHNGEADGDHAVLAPEEFEQTASHDSAPNAPDGSARTPTPADHTLPEWIFSKLTQLGKNVAVR